MSFNNNTFEHINYNAAAGAMHEAHSYEAPDGSYIVTKPFIKELGITLSWDNTTSHINAIVKRARSQAGWVLRTFRTRSMLPMLTLYRSLAAALLEDCCQRWCPWRAGETQSLEAGQRWFTSRTSSLRHLDYWERLKTLNLYSLERRRERYSILYVHKSLIAKAVNTLNLRFTPHQRRGRICRIEKGNPRATTRLKTLKGAAFATRGPLTPLQRPAQTSARP